MAKNTGKKSEKIFEERLDRYGKDCVYFRLVDASEITGRTGKVAVSARAQPSDYIVTYKGKTAYAEVKSTQNPTSFPFSLLKKTQTAAATMVVAAGGDYYVFAHNLLTDQWYRFPYSLVQRTQASGKQSIPWGELETYAWTPNTTITCAM